MRLLFLTERLSYAGTATYTLDLAGALRERGDEVQLCSRGGDLKRAFEEIGVETYALKLNPFSLHRLYDFLRDFHPELIHVQNLRSMPFAHRIIHKLRLPFVVTVHRVPGPDVPSPKDPYLAGVIASNELIREAMVNEIGIPKHLIRVIPRGVNTRLLSPESGGAPEQDWIPVVGSVGSLTRVKGHHVFLRAARKVLDRGVEAMFAIVGEGEEEYALRRQVKELGLHYHVTFSPHIPNRRELFRVFDIVVVPTLRGGVGVAVLEAMSMAKPVIASAVGELLHIVEDQKTGLLVPEGDEDALAERIVELLARPDLRRALGESARAYVVEGFSLLPMVDATRAFHADVLRTVRETAAEPQAAPAG